ncbi:unnamed protein product [Durusdinium trenchii]|uniref:BD-FAE-like domain-containing protein n=1 Tax=Durusdinium trenchii TaxID=1381693 RepID=A0ABP0HWA7_9DINO
MGVRKSVSPLLHVHSLLGLRWCLLPLVVLASSGSVLVACELAGSFAVWSLAVIFADASQNQKSQAGVLLITCIVLTVAALSTLPLVGLEVGAMAIIYLGLAGGIASVFGWRVKAVLYAAWAVGEAIAGVAVSGGLIWGAWKLLGTENGIEQDWLFLWCIFWGNGVLSLISLALVPLLLLRRFRKEELEALSPCGEEVSPWRCTSGIASPVEPPVKKCRQRSIRILLVLAASACACCMVAASAVFMMFHCFPPGLWLETMKPELPWACQGCFCANASADVLVTRNVKYGSAYSERDGSETELFLDVYRRSHHGSAKAPAVLMIHGGNFMGGSKDWELIATEAEHFARAGYVVFNIDYRVDGSFYLVDLPAVRAAVHDAKAAVRFIARHAEEYGVDATRIAAWGESAGGITAISMNSLASEGSSGNPGWPSNISVAVSISGTMWPFLVGDPSNPVRNITPWFNVHGTDDSIVFPFLPVMTHTYLLARGMPATRNRIVWVKGAGHVPWGTSSPLDVSSSLRPLIFDYLSNVMDLSPLCATNKG